MAKIIAMYKTPTDPAAFDRYYFGPHVKLAKTVPGLKGYEVTRGPVMTPAGPAPFYLVADPDVRFDGGDPGGAGLCPGTGHCGGHTKLRDGRRRNPDGRFRSDLMS